MKMAKKLLAVALAGVLALSVLTGCGNSTGTKSIADAMNDMLKGRDITVKSDSDLNAKVKKIVELKDQIESKEPDNEQNKAKTDGVTPTAKTEIMKIMGDAYNDQFVWIAYAPTKGYNTTAQAAELLRLVESDELVLNAPTDKDKNTIKTYRIGTTTLTEDGDTVRIALIAAEADDAE